MPRTRAAQAPAGDMTVAMQDLLVFLVEVDKLVAMVEFDDGGRMVGLVRTGGNGGLLASETIHQATIVRRESAALRELITAAADAADP